MFLGGNQEVNSNCIYKNLILNDRKELNVLLKESYDSFCNCMSSNVTFRGKKVWYKTEMDLHNNRELGFEHLVSMKKSGLRIYEKNRTLYVPLIKEILSRCSNNHCGNISIYRDGKDICVWCRDNRYLIVLNERKNGYLLNTAYPVIYSNKLYEVEKKANENGL